MLRRDFLRLAAAAAAMGRRRATALTDPRLGPATFPDRELLRRRLAAVNADIGAHGLRAVPGIPGLLLTGYPYNEFYDWDLYFENLYLSYYGVWLYCFTNLEEFLRRQDPDGYINRSLIKRRDRQHFKPFLAQLAILGCRQHPEAIERLRGDRYHRLGRYLDKWFSYDGDGNGLPTWNSADAAGTDNQWSRAGALASFSVEGVDLASYLVRELDAMAALAERLHLPGDARGYRDRARLLRRTIEATFWHEADGMYYDRNERTGELVRVKSATNFMPLFAGAASPERARRTVREHLLNPKEFWLPYPVASYAKTEPDYYQGSHRECNWRGPTWAPTNYMIFQGLRAYGFHPEAAELADRLQRMALVQNSALREYYDAETGEGLGQTHFWGFTALYYVLPLELETGYVSSALTGSARALVPERLDVRFEALAVSANQRELVAEGTSEPVFLLGDTAWNLNALTDDEFTLYLRNRAGHGFNLILFALDFAPQASARDAYGEAAYGGPEAVDLNSGFFSRIDARVRAAAGRGVYVMLFPLWSGLKAGIINRYSVDQLHRLGLALGRRYAASSNVLWSAAGEATPPYVDVERVKAIGSGLKTGSKGRNLITVHPMSGHNSGEYYGDCPWLDFSLIQAKSGNGRVNAAYDAAALVEKAWSQAPTRPVMMGEHRYESGTGEDPVIQRRSLYQCAFAGACGHVYGHDALWQMTPHTAQPWMLHGWNPGVARWQDALDTPAVRQLHHIRKLLKLLPKRFPDQHLVLAGQGASVASRVQALRDGTPGQPDATFVAAYLSGSGRVELDLSVIADSDRELFIFDPASGSIKSAEPPPAAAARIVLPQSIAGAEDGVVIVADSHAARRVLE